MMITRFLFNLFKKMKSSDSFFNFILYIYFLFLFFLIKFLYSGFILSAPDILTLILDTLSEMIEYYFYPTPYGPEEDPSLYYIPNNSYETLDDYLASKILEMSSVQVFSLVNAVLHLLFLVIFITIIYTIMLFNFFF